MDRLTLDQLTEKLARFNGEASGAFTAGLVNGNALGISNGIPIIEAKPARKLKRKKEAVYPAEAAFILDVLKALGLYRKSHLYRGFDGDFLFGVVKAGTDRIERPKKLMSEKDFLRLQQIVSERISEITPSDQLGFGIEASLSYSAINPLIYANQTLRPAISVYLRRNLRTTPEDGIGIYEFKDAENKADSLVAIFTFPCYLLHPFAILTSAALRHTKTGYSGLTKAEIRKLNYGLPTKWSVTPI